MLKFPKAQGNGTGRGVRAASGPGRGKAAVTFAAQLTLEDVSRRYGEVLALDGVSIDISPSEVLCLLGPSGCGKSTLLRVAAGIERPSSGRILLDGQEVAGPDNFVPPEKRGIGLMFQDFALFPHLSLLDNVAFGLKSLTRSDAKREARAALERVGLAHYANEYPHILSGGEQQRVALMRQGWIVQTGKALDLYRAPKDILTARTFSELNELAARIEGGSAATPLGRFAANGVPDGADAIVCVRQRGVRLRGAGQGVPGRVLDARFLGDVALVEVAVQGLDAPLFARIAESDVPPQGSEVGVVIEPGAVIVFAAGNGVRPAS
jgi:iron(III) transport system ATP-binding protein